MRQKKGTIMEDFKHCVGNTQIETDIVTERPIQMMRVLLDYTTEAPNALPHLYHWCYFLPIAPHSMLAEDGHPKKGGFLPPITFPKRMWAGARLEFVSDIAIGSTIRRESTISNVVFKQGKSGDMYFVTVIHHLYADDQLAIIEEHDIVYREATNQIAATSQTQVNMAMATDTPDRQGYEFCLPRTVDTVTLFRYSAVTFNGHKIHYDRDYTTKVEGYPGLVVHGPLLATLLLEGFKAQYPTARVKRFDFRAVKPVFDFNEFYICGNTKDEVGELWIEHADGSHAMNATVTFE